MSSLIKTAVIAGTPVDTQMGVEYIEKKTREAGSEPGFMPLYCPAALDCDDQVKFQYSDNDEKRAIMDNIFNQAIQDGASDFFIYCNSLSGSFDFDSYAVLKSIESGKDIRIYTPLQVYRRLGGEYGRVGVEALMAANPDIYMIGTGNMAIVRAIEDDLSPEEIVDKCGIAHLLKYFETCEAEALVLGCTHFPYIKGEIEKLTDLPIVNPADEMFEALSKATR